MNAKREIGILRSQAKNLSFVGNSLWNVFDEFSMKREFFFEPKKREECFSLV